MLRKFKLADTLLGSDDYATVEFADGKRERIKSELQFVGDRGASGYAFWDGESWCIVQMGLPQ